MNTDGRERPRRSDAVGILGGGQLARMLAEAALRLGLAPIVLAEAASDPAAQLCPAAVLGSMRDEATLRRFFSQVPLVAFENEFVDCALLERAAAGVRGVPIPAFLPGLEAIATLQDKLSQKRLLEKLGIPTAPCVPISKAGDLASLPWPDGFVLKWATLGYDGKGTRIAPDAREARRFLEEARARGVEVFAEARARFRRELAVIGCRSVTGELATYPLVVSEQEQGICRRVRGPATALGTPPALEEAARGYVRRIAEGVGLIGCFAIELFETESGGLWVNELAPRVHNSGHYTQDCAETSQFENHWRALLGLPLGPVDASPAFAMLNLLGPDGGKVPALPRPDSMTHLHWYGKGEVRPGRKMGHLNGNAGSPAELSALLERMARCEEAWARETRGSHAP